MRKQRDRFYIKEVTSVLDTAEAAKHLRTTMSHMYQMRSTKTGPVYTVTDVHGKPYYLYKVSDLNEWRSTHKKRRKRKPTCGV